MSDPSDERMARLVRRWTLPIWVVFTGVWVVWWGYRFFVEGGLDSMGSLVTMVFSGIAAMIGLGTGWWMRRQGPPNT